LAKPDRLKLVGSGMRFLWVAGVVLSQKRAASAADEMQMHHDAFYSYALLILLGGGSKAVVCGQLYVDPSFILPISTTW